MTLFPRVFSFSLSLVLIAGVMAPCPVFADCKEYRMVESDDKVEVVCVGDPPTPAELKARAEEEKRQEQENRRQRAEAENRQKAAETASAKAKAQEEAARKNEEAARKKKETKPDYPKQPGDPKR
jgi:septal ring factor EnvC (AmiA/AmiB activator)